MVPNHLGCGCEQLPGREDQENWRSAILPRQSISTPRLSWSSSLSVISWLLVISSLVVVLVTGWNPIIHTIVKAWVFVLVFLGVTKRPEDVTDGSEVDLFHKRVFWFAVILIATPLVGLYVYRSDNTQNPLEPIRGTLLTLAPLLALALVVYRNAWYRLPSVKFWKRLFPLVFLVLLVKFIVGLPFVALDMYAFENTPVVETTGAVPEHLESPTTTNFMYSALTLSFSEELDRTGTLLAGITNPYLNTLLWAVNHDLRMNRWAEIAPPFADQPGRLRVWLTVKNTSYLTMLLCVGLVFFRVLKSEQSIWAAFLVHFLSNELPGLLFSLF